MSVVPISRSSQAASNHSAVGSMRCATEEGDWDRWTTALGELVAAKRADLPPLTPRQVWDALGRDVRHLLLEHMDEAGIEDGGPQTLFASRAGVDDQLLRTHTLEGSPVSERERALATMLAVATTRHPRLAGLGETFGLDLLELAIITVLYVGEVDPVVGRSLRFAVGHYALNRPDRDLVAGLLLGPPSPLWALIRDRLRPAGTLRRYALLTLAAEGELELAGAVVEFLDRINAPSGVQQEAGTIPLDDAVVSGATRLVEAGNSRLILVGAQDMGPDLYAGAIAARLHKTTTTVDGGRLSGAVELGTALRDARLSSALPYLDMHGREASEIRDLISRLRDRFPSEQAIIGVEGLGRELDRLHGTATVELRPMTAAQRRATWEFFLNQAGVRTSLSMASDLAERYPLPLRGIESAVAEARAQMARDVAASPTDCLRAAAVQQIEHRLGALAERVSNDLSWADVVLPGSTLDSLMEMISFARYRDHVLDDWGFGRKLPYGRALTALFHGPPGTGKTMVASLIAKELGAEMFRVDLSAITSKWIGETEKNLAHVFAEARRHGAVLLFDEADSLFGRRTEVKSSSDRYGNMNVNFLLQAIEDHEGVVILTTNLDSSIDEAFRRRIRFSIEFAQPKSEEREHLWSCMLPRRAEHTDDIDFGALADEFDMSGAYIKESTLRAAFMAAEAGSAIDHAALHRAARRVYREMGHMVQS